MNGTIFFLFFSNIFNWITNSNFRSINFEALNISFSPINASIQPFNFDVTSYIISSLPKMIFPIVMLAIMLLSYLSWIVTCKCFKKKYTEKCLILRNIVIFIVVLLSILAVGMSVVNNIYNNTNYQITNKLNQPINNLIDAYDESIITFSNIYYDDLLPYKIIDASDIIYNDTIIYNNYDQNKILSTLSIIENDLKIIKSCIDYINTKIINIDILYILLSYGYVINMFILIILTAILIFAFRHYKDKKYENISQYFLDNDKFSEIKGKCLKIKNIYNKIKENSNGFILNILTLLFILLFVAFCSIFIVGIFVGDVSVIIQNNEIFKRYENNLMLYNNISLVDTVIYYLSCDNMENPFVNILSNIETFVYDENKNNFSIIIDNIENTTNCIPFNSAIKYAIHDIVDQLSYSIKTIIVAHLLIYIAIIFELIALMIASKIIKNPELNVASSKVHELRVIKNDNQHYFLSDEIKSINENAQNKNTLDQLTSISH